MSTPSGCGARTGGNQTRFAGQNPACNGVAVLGRSHGRILNHTSSCCHLRSELCRYQRFLLHSVSSYYGC
jgi:hypothetical protein